jgi:glyoxylase-like metal-dependent hydrolase (beta-lactamase superfamily II)
MNTDNFYFRQLLAGRDFARSHPVAGQLANFCYLMGDEESKKAMVVDPAWDVSGLLTIAQEDGMEIEGVLATHCHPDHIGGDLFGLPVEGIGKLLELKGMKVHVHKDELELIKKLTGVSDSDLVTHEGGDKIQVGEVEIECLHTPGHSPGSQCFLVQGRLVSGDTLFVNGCGRVDLPGSDPAEMYRSLTERLSILPGEVKLFPGHDYGDRPTSTLEEERRTNYYLRVPTVEDWLRLMG